MEQTRHPQDAPLCNNSVQPDNWQSALPRPFYNQRSPLHVTGNYWYEIYQVLPGVQALYEPGHFQEVISFLITGSEKALLWDTGMGLAPIKPLIAQLTQLPLTVVNSHSHFDHVGSNWEFPQVYGYPEAGASRCALAGYPPDFLRPMLEGNSLAKPLPASFDPANYRIPPWKSVPVIPGQVFDLGDRQLEVLYTPGHTDDSIMLLDRGNRTLFTGDTVYPAALYAHYNSADFGHSRLDIYSKTIQALVPLVPQLDHLCCSHNLALVDPSILIRIRDGFNAIQNNQALGKVDAEGLTRYDFADFAIITN